MATGDLPTMPDPGLGARVETFGPAVVHIVAGVLISVLFTSGGVVAFGIVYGGLFLTGGAFGVLSGVLFGVVGLASLAAGVGFALHTRRLIGHRVDVCANGFRVRVRRLDREVRWVEVRRVRETVLYEKNPFVDFPASLVVPKVASSSYAVVTLSGDEYEFHGDSVRKIDRLGRLLWAQARRLSLPWETVEVNK